MEVVFSDHAILRCQQSGIHTGYIRSIIGNLPDFRGEIRWRVPQGHEVVVAQKGDRRVVITVISKERRNARRRVKR